MNRRAPAYMTETPGCVTETHSYTENGRPRAQTVTRTPVGQVSTMREPAGLTSWTIEHLFKAPEDYKVLRYIVENERYRPSYDEFARAERWVGEDVVLRAGVGSTPLRQIMIVWMGVETFAVEWAERRDELLRLEGIMRAKRRDVYHILAGAPVTHADYGGNEVPEVMGRERFAEFCVPVYNECADVFHEKGKLLGAHLDGNNRAWAHLVAESRLDYVEAFTPAPDTDMTLREALDAWPDKVLWMDFPSSVHLASADKIKETARELIDAASSGQHRRGPNRAAGANRLIMGITEDIPEDRWQENLLAISEAINER